MGIEPLNPKSVAEVDAVALLHEEHLGDSPIVMLGRQFLRDFYYPKLIEEGLLECAICKADGRVVAFISWTRFPDGFMMQGIRRHVVLLSWIMLKQVLRKPSSVRDIFAAVKIVRERSSGWRTKPQAGTAETISIVVLPQYQKHVPPGGKSRLTVRLFEELGAKLRSSGMERVTFLVKPENRASNIFLSAIGCQFEKVTEFGVQAHKYTFDLGQQGATRGAE
jgi:hypothetical protein